MKTTVHKADSRGLADHGWLRSRHTFSFAGYYNPQRMNFGVLRVLNDDIVKGGYGFGTHPHDNMEIVSIPLRGTLAHRDSMGHAQPIELGEVQIMSAGSGLTHSEFNHSRDEDVNFLQIWVLPKEKNIKPRYDQKKFSVEERQNSFQTVVSPDRDGDALWINQDAYFSLARLDADKTLSYELRQPGNGIYVFVISGAIRAGKEDLDSRDAAGFEETSSLEISAQEDSEILVIEVPMH